MFELFEAWEQLPLTLGRWLSSTYPLRMIGCGGKLIHRFAAVHRDGGPLSPVKRYVKRTDPRANPRSAGIPTLMGALPKAPGSCRDSNDTWPSHPSNGALRRDRAVMTNHPPTTSTLRARKCPARQWGICQRWAIRMPGPHGGLGPNRGRANGARTDFTTRVSQRVRALIVRPEQFGVVRPGCLRRYWMSPKRWTPCAFERQPLARDEAPDHSIAGFTGAI